MTLALVLGVLIGLIPAAVAANKGRSFMLWWLFGFLLFIVAMPMALMVGPGDGARKCPSCAEVVRAEAQVCKHCGRDLPMSARAAGPSFEPTPDYLG